MIIDLHAHYTAPELCERLEKNPGGAPAGVSTERAANGRPRFRIGSFLSSPMPKGMDDLEECRRAMARQGVDGQWLTPWVSLLAYELDGEAGAAWSRMVNETTTAALKGEPGFWGAATVPLQDGKLAARELEYALGLGLKGAILGTHVAGKGLDDPDLEPFWAAAAAARAPLFIHPFGITHGTRLDRYHLKNLVGNPADTTVSVGQLIFGGVCDRHPGLRVLLAHGGGFFPYQVGRWNHGFRTRKETQVHLRKPPGDYLRFFFYDTMTHGSPALAYLVGLAGADRVVLGTDYPFEMADPDPRGTIRGAKLSERERAQVEEETAAGFLGV